MNDYQKYKQWTLADEIKFINGIGSHREESPGAINTVETLLRRYRKLLEQRQDTSFDKTQALMRIDYRLKEILDMRAAALKGWARPLNQHAGF